MALLCLAFFCPLINSVQVSMNKLKGIALVILSAASFGTLAIFGRFAYTGGVDTITLLFLRFTFAAAFMLVILSIRREKIPQGRELARLSAMGGIGYVAQSFCFLTAIKFASAGLVALLLYLYPVFVAILSTIFLKERITRVKILALSLAVVGISLTVNPQGGQPLGIILAMFAAGIYSVYIVVGSSVMQKVSAVQSSTVIFTSAAIVFGMMVVINGAQWPHSIGGWAAVAAVATLSTIIPVMTFLAGLKYVSATDASLFSTFEPVVTVFLASLLLDENLPASVLLGGGLILVAGLIAVRNERGQKQPLLES
jgi:drug/metabolite transporter (DMT)-like permease